MGRTDESADQKADAIDGIHHDSGGDDSTPESVVRYGVIDKHETWVDALGWCPHEERKEADLVRKGLDKLYPEHEPHQVVAIRAHEEVEG